MTVLAILMLAVLVAAVIGCSIWAKRDIGRTLAHRGEVADVPELPRDKTCPLNATPHWCCDPAEWLPSVPYGTGESLARELTDYLKGSA